MGIILDKLDIYSKDITNNLKKNDTWKIQLTIVNDFISSLDNDEERVMYSQNGNIKMEMKII